MRNDISHPMQYEKDMDLFLTYIPLISVAIVAGLFTVALVNFSTVRKNMQVQSEQQIRNLKIQSEQQIYSRIMDARLKLESTETFTNMAKESPIFAERFTAVDSPDEYYIIVAFLDLFEFLFRLNKRDMIDTEIWSRWKGLVKTIMTIPKFRRVWEKTKDVHAHEFREFVDSLDSIS
ncbi:MAG TPA: hypothetical protein VFS97_00160 [Nitrososphaeraceae archaeon]|nr:hypothetical protein [Nitrososphaeraceae archaeon]